jgi:hypothetical protein
MIFATLLLCAFAAIGSAKLEQLGRGAPSGWQETSKPIAPETPFEIRLALKQSDVGKQRLESETLNRADPDHQLYGQWLTQAEVLDLVAPSLAVTQKVVDWVESHGKYLLFLLLLLLFTYLFFIGLKADGEK